MRQYLEASQFKSLGELTSAVESNVSYLFFTHTLCPYAERVWLSIEELPDIANVTALVHVDLSKKPSWFRDVSPRGLVPTVVHENKVHVESMDIAEWLLNDQVRNPSIVSEISSLCLDACGGNAGCWQVGTAISERQLRALEQGCDRVLTDDMKLIEKIVVYPFLYRTMVVLRRAYGVDMGALCDGKVGEFMNAMMDRQSCATTSADEVRFGKAMQDGGLDFFDYRTTKMFDFHPHMSR